MRRAGASVQSQRVERNVPDACKEPLPASARPASVLVVERAQHFWPLFTNRHAQGLAWPMPSRPDAGGVAEEVAVSR
eukprot:9402946-Lingulodinium_polyedra.AAC.1